MPVGKRELVSAEWFELHWVWEDDDGLKYAEREHFSNQREAEGAYHSMSYPRDCEVWLVQCARRGERVEVKNLLPAAEHRPSQSGIAEAREALKQATGRHGVVAHVDDVLEDR